MRATLLTEHHLEFLRLKEAAQARQNLHLSNATLLEITCRGSCNVLGQFQSYFTYIILYVPAHEIFVIITSDPV